ncbi:MAG: hypothetical protein HRU41_38135 [Saprospiraceae bacterium]|nr:hypothetical protein [Saprospiraceae bacterium]
MGQDRSSDTILNRLYNGIYDGKYNSDEEAAEDLFAEDRHKNEYYGRIKRQLKERLYNTLFLIDTNEPNYSDLQKAYYSSYKNSAAVKILIGKQNRAGAIPLALKTLKVAQKYEFTDLVLALAKELRTHFGMLIGDKKKFDHYNSLVKRYKQIYDAELLAEEYYTAIVVHFVNSSANKKDVISLAETLRVELVEKSEDVDSYWFNYFTYLTIISRYEIANDYENVITTCNQALRYFASKKHLVSKRTLFNFQFRTLGAHIKLKQFQTGFSKIDECLELTLAGSINWYSTLHYLMIISYHARNFDQAYATYNQATSHANFKIYFKNLSENWKLHEAFVYYFLITGRLNLSPAEKPGTFRISKFMNQVPTFSKDKRGTNITVIILQLLLLLQQKKYGAIIDRMEPLQAYAHRYLRQDDTFRSNCFIKMLLCLPAASFHKVGVLRKADKYWKKLQTMPIEKANQSAEMEIVPYEMLWEFVLEGLDEKWH